MKLMVSVFSTWRKVIFSHWFLELGQVVDYVFWLKEWDSVLFKNKNTQSTWKGIVFMNMTRIPQEWKGFKYSQQENKV